MASALTFVFGDREDPGAHRSLDSASLLSQLTYISLKPVTPVLVCVWWPLKEQLLPILGRSLGHTL